MAEITPAETYIGLARLGRTDGWGVVRAVTRIALYIVLFIFLGGVAIGAVSAFAPKWAALASWALAEPLGEQAQILIAFSLVLWAIRDAVVKSQRRPFLSLFGPDLRVDWRRILLGAGIWLVAMLIGLGLQALIGIVLGHALDLPDTWPFSWSMLPVAVFALVAVPLQAGTEELLCRGWLTQMLGQPIRSRLVVVLLVAAVFALLHAVPSLFAIGYYMILSLIFSAITLRDGRLELSIGAHAAQNLFVLLVVSPIVEHTPTLLGSDPGQMPWTELPLALGIGGLAYLLTGWLAPRLSPAAFSPSR
jgi:membrane protease YdiL (CAAX protease family)